MEIYGADLRGIDGELIRFRILGEKDASGVNVLGNARKVTSQGAVERCMKAIQTMEGFQGVGEGLRYTIDLTPVEAKVQSAGIDLPLAVSILRATVMQSNEDLRNTISSLEEKLKKTDEARENAKNLEKRAELRKNILARIEMYRGYLKNIESYHDMIAKNNTEYLLIGKLDITTGAIDSPRDGMLGMIAAIRPNMTVIVPESAEAHAAIVVNGMERVAAFKARDITEVWSIVTGQVKGRKCQGRGHVIPKPTVAMNAPDLRDIIGCSRAKLALETALAGRHSLLFVGPAGGGKSMLAKAATQLLPELESAEVLEVNKIYSARGELSQNELVLTRPYQEVSNGVTEAALFGGGTSIRPGLISAAHRGILFFDEVNLTPSSVLENLREPWSSGEIKIQRANGSVRMPAKFQFIGAMNPCKCAMHFHYSCRTCKTTLVVGQRCKKHPYAERDVICTCSKRVVDKYLGSLSEPIKDRIEIVCLVSRYDQDDSWHDHQATRTVRARIKAAWETQRKRFSGFERYMCNSDVPNINEMLRTGCLVQETKRMMEISLERSGAKHISLRKLTQLLSLVRTVADLENSPHVTSEHVSKTISISGLDQGII